MKVRISCLSLEHTNTWCQILLGFSLDKGSLEGLTLIYQSSTVSLLAMLRLCSPSAHNPKLNAEIDEWLRMLSGWLDASQRLVTALVFLCWLAVIASGIPGSYVSHTFLHVWMGFLQYGLSGVTWAEQAGIENRIRAVIALLHSIWWTKTNAYDRDKIMSAALNRQELLFFLCLHLLWLEMTWKSKQLCFMCTTSLICFSHCSGL